MAEILLYLFVIHTLIFLLEQMIVLFRNNRKKRQYTNLSFDISYIGNTDDVSKTRKGELQKSILLYKWNEYTIGTYRSCDIRLPKKLGSSCLGRFLIEESIVEFQLGEGEGSINGNYIAEGTSVWLKKGDILRLGYWMVRIVETKN